MQPESLSNIPWIKSQRVRGKKTVFLSESHFTLIPYLHSHTTLIPKTFKDIRNTRRQISLQHRFYWHFRRSHWSSRSFMFLRSLSQLTRTLVLARTDHHTNIFNIISTSASYQSLYYMTNQLSCQYSSDTITPYLNLIWLTPTLLYNHLSLKTITRAAVGPAISLPNSGISCFRLFHFLKLRAKGPLTRTGVYDGRCQDQKNLTRKEIESSRHEIKSTI